MTSPSDPPPTVLAPGLLCDARLWWPAREHAATRTQTVDLLGADSLEAMADRILDAAEPGAAVAGFSMGGMAALLAASRAPGRIGALMILSTHAEPDTPAKRAAREAQVASARDEGLTGLVRDSLKPLYFADAADRDADRALIMDMAARQGPEGLAAQVGAIIARPDLERAARAVVCPVIVATGEHDAIAPPGLARRLAALIPRAEVVILPDAGHLAPLDAPAAVAGLLDRLPAIAARRTAA